jgi:hypothetical protein
MRLHDVDSLHEEVEEAVARRAFGGRISQGGGVGHAAESQQHSGTARETLASAHQRQSRLACRVGDADLRPAFFPCLREHSADKGFVELRIVHTARVSVRPGLDQGVVD